MSRIGKQPIAIPAKVTITINKNEITVTGPRGSLNRLLHPAMTVEQQDGQIIVTRPTDNREHRALHGLTRALIANMVKGVSDGFRRSLIVEGVGYAGEVRGSTLNLRLGYSHDINVDAPEDIKFTVEGRNPTMIHVDGIDKQVVGQIAANIRELRPPEPYLGKGIRYSDEILRRKEGKSAKK